MQQVEAAADLLSCNEVERQTAVVRRRYAWHTLLRDVCLSMHAVNRACQAGGKCCVLYNKSPESEVNLRYCIHVMLCCCGGLLHLWVAQRLQCMSSHLRPVAFQCNPAIPNAP